MEKLNIIFPMCGESSRFNYKFKPFLQISDLTFIELAFKYFKKYIKIRDFLIDVKCPIDPKIIIGNNYSRIDFNFKCNFNERLR